MISNEPPTVPTSGPARQKADALWLVRDVAAYLNVSKRTVQRHMRENGLPYRKVGRFARFIPAEVEAWVTQQDRAA